MSNGFGPMCEPIEHEGRTYHVIDHWTSWGNWVEISGDGGGMTGDRWGRATGGTVILPEEVALRVAAEILRQPTEDLLAGIIDGPENPDGGNR